MRQSALALLFVAAQPAAGQFLGINPQHIAQAAQAVKQIKPAEALQSVQAPKVAAVGEVLKAPQVPQVPAVGEVLKGPAAVPGVPEVLKAITPPPEVAGIVQGVSEGSLQNLSQAVPGVVKSVEETVAKTAGIANVSEAVQAVKEGVTKAPVPPAVKEKVESVVADGMKRAPTPDPKKVSDILTDASKQIEEVTSGKKKSPTQKRLERVLHKVKGGGSHWGGSLVLFAVLMPLFAAVFFCWRSVRPKAVRAPALLADTEISSMMSGRQRPEAVEESNFRQF